MKENLFCYFTTTARALTCPRYVFPGVRNDLGRARSAIQVAMAGACFLFSSGVFNVKMKTMEIDKSLGIGPKRLYASTQDSERSYV